MGNYADNYECRVNNYCTKTIDCENCGICEFLKFSEKIVPDTVMYSCERQKPNRWNANLNRLLLQEFPPFKLARWICEKLEKFLGEVA